MTGSEVKFLRGTAAVSVLRARKPENRSLEWLHNTPQQPGRKPREETNLRDIRLSALCAALLFATPVAAQSFSHDISLSGLGNGNSSTSFGIAADASTHRIWVAVCGSFTGNNNVVAEIDTLTDTVVRTIPVGLYPEDIELLRDASGIAVTGAVTNSSSGTVSLWDLASGIVTHTVTLPDPFAMGSCYPFGITAGGPGLYVTTVDGSGDVHAIDLSTMTVDSAAGRNVGWKSSGRPKVIQNILVVPTTAYTAAWTGSEAGVAGFDLSGSSPNWSLGLVEDDGNWIFPSGTDVAVLPDGSYVVAGLNLANRLYRMDAQGKLLHAMRLSTATGSHGLALNDAGTLLVAVDLGGSTLTFIDTVQWVELGTVSTNSVGQGYSMPNDAVIVDGKLYVTSQANEELMVFDQLPQPGNTSPFAGTLGLSDSSPVPGDALTANLSGTGVVALFGCFEDTSGSYQGFPLQLTNPRLLAHGTQHATLHWTVPTSFPRGKHLFTQGIVDCFGTPTVTEPRMAIIQ